MTSNSGLRRTFFKIEIFELKRNLDFEERNRLHEKRKIEAEAEISAKDISSINGLFRPVDGLLTLVWHEPVENWNR